MWSVVITGAVSQNDAETTARRLATLLKIKPSQAHKLLSNVPVTIRRGLAAEQAERMQRALEKHGVSAELESANSADAQTEPESPDTSPSPEAPKAVQQRPSASAPSLRKAAADPTKTPVQPTHTVSRPAAKASPAHASSTGSRRSVAVLGSLVVVLTLGLLGAGWTIHRLLSFNAESPVFHVDAGGFSTFDSPAQFQCGAGVAVDAPWDITDLSHNRVAQSEPGVFRYINNLAEADAGEVHVLSVPHGDGRAEIDGTDQPVTLVLLSSGISRWKLDLTRNAHVERVLVHPNVASVRFQRMERDYRTQVLQHVMSRGEANSISNTPVLELEPAARCISAYPDIQGAAERRTRLRSEHLYKLLGQRESSFQTLGAAVMQDSKAPKTAFRIPVPGYQQKPPTANASRPSRSNPPSGETG